MIMIINHIYLGYALGEYISEPLSSGRYCNTHLFTRLFMEHSPEGSSKNIKQQKTRLLTRVLKQQTKKRSTRMGFEPTHAEHIGLAVQRLNHSATSSIGNFQRNRSSFVILLWRPLSVSWYSFDLISNQLFQIGKEEKIYRNSSNKAKVHDIFG